MRFGTAIERLVDNYQYAKSKIWIRDEVAWALYHTWKEADDRKTEPIQIIIPKNHGRKQAFAMIDEIYAMADRKTEPTQNQHIQSVESVGEDRKTESNSEIPNNCGHITEDGVTCAKYPACDDCLDNPLNKVKGSERLVKSSEQTDCQTCKWWSSYGYCVHRECKGYEPKTERSK